MAKLEAPSLELIMENWERDSQIDTIEPGKEMIRIPVLHNKYNKYLSLHSLAVKRAQLEIDKTRKVKWLYYNGKMDHQELKDRGWEPFPFTLKSDLNVYLQGDNDLSALQGKKSYHEEAVSYCTYIMKELNNRTWQMKEFMAWERFIRGQ